MYSIYANNVCIFDDASVSEDLKLVNPMLTLEDNNAGSLKFTMPPSNVGYSIVERMTTEIVVKKNGSEFWSGRVAFESSDFYNIRTVECEGELAYLNDTSQPQARYSNITVRQFLEGILNQHNIKVDASKRFSVGIVTIQEAQIPTYRYTDYEKTIECIYNRLLDQYGGHLKVRKENGVRYLDYYADYPNVCTQVINFGVNLFDFTKSFDMTELATVILPLGAPLDESPIDGMQAYLDVREVNQDSPFVIDRDSDAINTYGWIEKIVHFDNEIVPLYLYQKAIAYLQDVQFEKMQLEVSALDLSYMSVHAEAIDLLDNVMVNSAPHGLQRYFPVTKLEIPLDRPENAKFTLGTNVQTSLTEINNSINTDLLNKIEEIPPPSSIIQSAVANATQLINNATNGFVTILQNSNHTQEILISDNADYTLAQSIWRWNINGLGYSSTGYNGTFGTAITMDGKIVADWITTGTMYADRIMGGTLTLGGVDNRNGRFKLLDGSGRTAIFMTNNGMTILSPNGSGGNKYYLSLSNDGQITGGEYSGDPSDLDDLSDSTNYSQYGIFDAAARIVDNEYTPPVTRKGFRIKTDMLSLVSERIAVCDSMSDSATSIWTVKNEQIPYVSSISGGTVTTRYLSVVNGLVVAY